MCKWPYLRVGLNILWGNSSFNNSFYTGHFLSNILGYRGVRLGRRAVGGCWKRDHCKHCIQKSEATCKVTCLVATLTIKLKMYWHTYASQNFQMRGGAVFNTSTMGPMNLAILCNIFHTFNVGQCFVNACLHKNLKTLAPIKGQLIS